MVAMRFSYRDMNNLLTDIELFCARHSMGESIFSLNAMNDKSFVSSLRKGRRLWPETELKVRAFMADYRADQAA